MNDWFVRYVEREGIMRRKKYDGFGLEINQFNKSSIVSAIDCDCGNIAKKDLHNRTVYVCPECRTRYQKKLFGEYEKMTIEEA